MNDSPERYWSRYAETYEKKLAYVVGEGTVRMMADVLLAQGALGDVLEMGCGPGRFSALLARNSTGLTCTDLSDEMLAEARRYLADLPNVTVQKSDCTDCGFDSESFDTVVMMNLTHVVQHPSQALVEGYRLLRPGGRLLVVDMTGFRMRTIDRIKLAARYLGAWGFPPRHGEGTLSPARLAGMVEEAGFTIERNDLCGESVKFIFVNAVRRASQDSGTQ